MFVIYCFLNFELFKLNADHQIHFEKYIYFPETLFLHYLAKKYAGASASASPRVPAPECTPGYEPTQNEAVMAWHISGKIQEFKNAAFSMRYNYTWAQRC